jgi:hypothetical protein
VLSYTDFCVSVKHGQMLVSSNMTNIITVESVVFMLGVGKIPGSDLSSEIGYLDSNLFCGVCWSQ